MFVKLARHTKLFPTNSDKTPAIKDWQTEATQDSDQIEAWQHQFPNGMFGSPTGALNGFWALDIDVRETKNGFDSFPRLQELIDAGHLGQTTPSGGLHLFFKWDPENPVRNKTNLAGMKGVDIRGDGGYVIMCPSKGYVFNKKRVNFEADLKPAPAWMIELYESQPDTKTKTVAVQVGEAQLKEMLFALDPTDEKYESRDGWQEVMRAIHSGSNGEDWGRELFLEWSMQHPGPWEKSPEAEIQRDWDSYSCGEKENETTLGTLFHHMKDDGVGVGVALAKVEDTMELDGKKPEYRMHLNKNGRLKNTANNAVIIFQHIEKIGIGSKDDQFDNPLLNSLVYDELRQEAVWFKAPPWDKKKQALRPIDDNDAVECQAFLSLHTECEFGKDRITDSMMATARRNPNHPIKNYLNSLEWDGQERLSKWMAKWLGTPSNKYVEAVSRKFLIGAAKRVFQPGCKFDNMVVLEGPQGCRKSSLVEALAKDWYSAPNIPLNALVDGKNDAITNCFGSWIIEMEEMASATLADDKLMKKFLSTKVDVITMKYDKFQTRYPRQFVFIGTINLVGDGKYLKDSTGNRRIWPILCRKTKHRPIDIEGFKEEVDQLWAEAMVAYRNGEQLHLTEAEDRVAEKEQEARLIKHHAFDLVEDWVYANLADKDKVHTSFIAHAIWGHGCKQSQLNMVAQTMKNLPDWEHKKQLMIDGRNRSGWVKVTDEID